MAFAATVATSAAARQAMPFDIKAGPVSDAIVAFGAQSGVTVGMLGSVAGLHSRGVKGRLSAERALQRLLAGTGLQAERIDSTTFRITRAPTVAVRPKPSESPPPPLAPPAPQDIVVTASKRGTPIGEYAGAVSILDGRSPAFTRMGARGTDALVDGVASLSSTNLGPGRNKLIIRGVADSSFTGPSQAIVGQYLGDVRLNYNAPDPDLNLYDMERVEVLEGPQGTLYGAGSLGGILRLVPNRPKLGTWAGSLSAGLSLTRDGAPGNDIAAMLNLPILGDRIGLRVTGYRSIAGGYIDDVGRHLSDVNRSKTIGGRADLRLDPGDGWTIDVGGLVQDINSRDGQYAERGLSAYRRSSTIAQPFDNDYSLGQLVVSKRWDRLDLVSATGYVHHDVTERFDATGYPSALPSAFDQDNRIGLLTNETRLSRHRSNGTGWLIGTSLIRNSERLTRTLGPIGSPMRIAGVRNSLTGGALYGEWTVGLGRRITVTAGGRVTYTHLAGEVLDLPRGGGDERSRTEKNVLPSLSLAWRPLRELTVYTRYQEGYRGGGLSVSASGSSVVAQRFLGDSIATFEAGARWGDIATSRISGSIGLTYAHWEHIQSDLVDASGLPYTANTGNGAIRGAEARIDWRIQEGLQAEASLFLNDSDLTQPGPGFEAFRHAELPDIARIGARAALSWRHIVHGDIAVSADASVRYFGHSKLGIGTGLDIVQGGYADTSIGTRIGTERAGVSIDVTNLLNDADNRFSLGNPFGVMEGRQITPQRPRTFRIGIDGRF